MQEYSWNCPQLLNHPQHILASHVHQAGGKGFVTPLHHRHQLLKVRLLSLLPTVKQPHLVQAQSRQHTLSITPSLHHSPTSATACSPAACSALPPPYPVRTIVVAPHHSPHPTLPRTHAPLPLWAACCGTTASSTTPAFGLCSSVEGSSRGQWEPDAAMM